MNLISKKDIRNLLKKSEAKPSKRFGQNFLISEKKIEEIIEVADIQPDDTILEIGPGVGNLTQELAKRAKKIIAIEKDGDMVRILKETLKDYKNIEIIQADILKNTTGSYPVVIATGYDPVIIDDKYKIVANLPFYIATAIIRKFLEAQNPPELMILTVQKEVGQRICAKPPKMSLLAVSVQFYAEAKIISYISKKLFWPAPKVDSAVIAIKPRINPAKSADRREVDITAPLIADIKTKQVSADLFFKIVKAGFSQPRKQIANNLAKNLDIGLGTFPAIAGNVPIKIEGQKGTEQDKKQIENWLIKNNIQPSRRAETLTLEDWLSLAKTLL